MAARPNEPAPGAAPPASAPAARIAALNDALRRSFTGGQVLVSAGVSALPEAVRCEVLAAVQGFDAFTPANDPHGEHDFGVLRVAGVRAVWKVDAYDLGLTRASPDPADPAVTTRVLTVMLAEEA